MLPAPWGVLAWIGGLLVVLRVLYAALCAAMDNYCDLIEATVAVHRGRLYRALGLDLPESTSAEPASGALLTGYLLAFQPVDLSLSWTADEAPEADAPAER